MSEQVLVISADRFQRFSEGKVGFIPCGVDAIRFLLAGELTFKPRDEVEEDESWKQIIPYVAMVWSKYVFRYTRGIKSGEQRLRSKKSIGLGGHINPKDGKDGFTCLENAMHRELTEELSHRAFTASRDILGLIYDDHDLVGRVHLGVCMKIRLNEPAAVANERESLMDAGFSHMSTIEKELEQYERWSRICFPEIVK